MVVSQDSRAHLSVLKRGLRNQSPGKGITKKFSNQDELDPISQDGRKEEEKEEAVSFSRRGGNTLPCSPFFPSYCLECGFSAWSDSVHLFKDGGAVR